MHGLAADEGCTWNDRRWIEIRTRRQADEQIFNLRIPVPDDPPLDAGTHSPAPEGIGLRYAGARRTDKHILLYAGSGAAACDVKEPVARQQVTDATAVGGKPLLVELIVEEGIKRRNINSGPRLVSPGYVTFGPEHPAGSNLPIVANRSTKEPAGQTERARFVQVQSRIGSFAVADV